MHTMACSHKVYIVGFVCWFADVGGFLILTHQRKVGHIRRLSLIILGFRCDMLVVCLLGMLFVYGMSLLFGMLLGIVANALLGAFTNAVPTRLNPADTSQANSNTADINQANSNTADTNQATLNTADSCRGSSNPAPDEKKYVCCVQYAGVNIGWLRLDVVEATQLQDQLHRLLAKHSKPTDKIMVFDQFGRLLPSEWTPNLQDFLKLGAEWVCVVTSGWASAFVDLSQTEFDVEQQVLRLPKSVWTRNGTYFADTYLEAWQDYCQLAVRMADRLGANSVGFDVSAYPKKRWVNRLRGAPNASKFMTSNVAERLRETHQNDLWMVELLEMVCCVWWRCDSQDCQANITIVISMVLDGLDGLDGQGGLQKMHFVDVLFAMFGVAGDSTAKSLTGKLVYESGKAILLANAIEKLATMYDNQDGVTRRRGMLYSMLKSVFKCGFQQSNLNGIVRVLLNDKTRMWKLLALMISFPGFWQAFFDYDGMDKAAYDFKFLDKHQRKTLKVFLSSIPQSTADRIRGLRYWSGAH